MKIQRFGTDGLALVHSADGREMISMTREQAHEVYLQLGDHFAPHIEQIGALRIEFAQQIEFHNAERARQAAIIKQQIAVIDGLRAEVVALKAQKVGSATIQFSSAMSPYSWEVDDSGYIDNSTRKPSDELIPYIPQEGAKHDRIHKSGCATERSGGRVCDCFLPQEAKQPPASILKDNKAAQNWAPSESYSRKYQAQVDHAEACLQVLRDRRTAESHANAATLPTSIMKGDKEISDLRGQIRSHASHANALRGNLERDTIEAGVKPADAGLGNAWKDGWKA